MIIDCVELVETKVWRNDVRWKKKMKAKKQEEKTKKQVRRKLS